jgi:uncharacterized Zn finger protein
MKLHPFDECVRDAKAITDKGHAVYQQFNCAKCGTKQTMELPNTFFTTGKCEECGHVTDIQKNGCNYMAHFVS